MSQGKACNSPQDHRPTSWFVLLRESNRSAFNGGRLTPSAYSTVECLRCGAVWRTKAAYVEYLSDM